MRTRPRFDNILRDVVFKFQQIKAGRMLLGGMYVRMTGVWLAVDVIRIAEDGTRFLRTEDNISFHESFVDVSAIESFT